MILIIFAVVFMAISLFFLRQANDIEKHTSSSSEYILTHIKGSARGSMGKIESNSMLEEKRRRLKKGARF